MLIPLPTKRKSGFDSSGLTVPSAGYRYSENAAIDRLAVHHKFKTLFWHKNQLFLDISSFLKNVPFEIMSAESSV